MTLFLRPSMVLAADDCRRMMYYKYIAGIRSEARPANLLFGTAIDVAIKGYLEGLVRGTAVDPVVLFADHWAKGCRENTVSYSREQSPEIMTEMGKSLMEQLPQAWRETGFIPYAAPDGTLVMGRRLNVTVAPGVVLSGELDLLCYDSKGETNIIDVKTASQETEFAFIRNSDQLKPYDIMVTANSGVVGLESVDGVGIWEFLKRKVPKTKSRGTGPMILPPKVVEAPSESDKAEYRQKVLWLVEDIHRGRFPKASRSPHNSPCNLCDYARLCSEGCKEGLIFPQGQELTLPIAA